MNPPYPPIDYAGLVTALQTRIEFDEPFTLDTDGVLTTARWARTPDCYYTEGDGVKVPDIETYPEWYPILHGFSGQHGYHGAIMHASEQISQGIVGKLLSHAEALGGEATFVIVAVDVLPDDEDPDPEPAGWTILATPTTYGAED